jgi:hypothetical protein
MIQIRANRLDHGQQVMLSPAQDAPRAAGAISELAQVPPDRNASTACATSIAMLRTIRTPAIAVNMANFRADPDHRTREMRSQS